MMTRNSLEAYRETARGRLGKPISPGRLRHRMPPSRGAESEWRDEKTREQYSLLLSATFEAPEGFSSVA